LYRCTSRVVRASQHGPELRTNAIVVASCGVTGTAVRSAWHGCRRLSTCAVSHRDGRETGALLAAAGTGQSLPDPGFSQGTTSCVHDMMRNLWGGGGAGRDLPGASAPRYGNTYRGQLEGHEFVVTNVLVTTVTNYPGAGPGINRPGSVCVMQLGGLLPSLTVNLRNRGDYQHLLTEPVRLGVADFDRRFDVRSGHPDFAARAVNPMIPVLMSRDDWVIYLEFAQLVSVCRAPFATVADVTGRAGAMLTLARAIPPDVWASTRSPGPPRRPIPASTPHRTGSGCGRSWMPCPQISGAP
jgi:hypothetical protein